MKNWYCCFVWGWCLLLNFSIAKAQKHISLEHVVQDFSLTQPLSICFTDSLEIITGDIFLYRKLGSEDRWSVSPADSTGAHALSWKHLPGGGTVYYAVGTNKNQLLRFNRLDRKPKVYTMEAVAELSRPHDIIYNPVDDYFYVINANYGNEEKYLLRFKDLDDGYEKLDLRPIIKHGRFSYARALTLVKGKLYIVLSSYGEVIRIDDFERGTYTYYGYHERGYASAGSYATTGLVLNDVAFYKGYWYGTNFFSSLYAEGTDYNTHRFIRWKTWDDFENERFENISSLLDKNVTPYFLTVHNKRLYLVSFQDEGMTGQPAAPVNGKIYVFK